MRLVIHENPDSNFQVVMLHLLPVSNIISQGYLPSHHNETLRILVRIGDSLRTDND